VSEAERAGADRIHVDRASMRRLLRWLLLPERTF
jgi:hypothetical protein